MSLNFERTTNSGRKLRELAAKREIIDQRKNVIHRRLASWTAGGKNENQKLSTVSMSHGQQAEVAYKKLLTGKQDSVFMIWKYPKKP